MAIRPVHELHERRRGRNRGVALALVGFALIVFAITVVKIPNCDRMEAFDHTLRPLMAESCE